MARKLVELGLPALGLIMAGGCAVTQDGTTMAAAEPAAAVAAPSASHLGSATGSSVQTGTNIAQMSNFLGAPKWTPHSAAPNAISSAPPPNAPTTEAPPMPDAPSERSVPVDAQPSPAPAQPAAPQAAAAQADAPAAQVDLAAGRQLFNDWSCGACHALADAGGTGSVGPSFDGNSGLTAEAAARIIANGQGAMPAFAGQLTDEEIGVLAAYIVQARR